MTVIIDHYRNCGDYGFSDMVLDSDFLSTKEAMQYIGKSYSTLRRWVKAGYIAKPHEPTAKTRYYSKKSINAFIKGQLLEDWDREVFMEKQRIDQAIIDLDELLKNEKLHRKSDEAEASYRARRTAMRAYSASLGMHMAMVQKTLFPKK